MQIWNTVSVTTLGVWAHYPSRTDISAYSASKPMSAVSFGGLSAAGGPGSPFVAPSVVLDFFAGPESSSAAAYDDDTVCGRCGPDEKKDALEDRACVCVYVRV